MKISSALYGVVTVVVGLFAVPYVVDVDVPTLAHQYPAVHTYGVPLAGLVMGVAVAFGLRALIERFTKTN